MTLAAVKKLAIKLPLQNRVKLAAAIWDSIPPEQESDVMAEVERRIDEVESGRVKPLTWHQFARELDKMEQSISHKRPRQRG